MHSTRVHVSYLSVMNVGPVQGDTHWQNITLIIVILITLVNLEWARELKVNWSNTKVTTEATHANGNSIFTLFRVPLHGGLISFSIIRTKVQLECQCYGNVGATGLDTRPEFHCYGQLCVLCWLLPKQQIEEVNP